VPIFDFAYQGFGRSIEADAEIVREYCSGANEAFICSSFSKNLGLYAERVGSLTAVSRSPAAIAPLASQGKAIVRTMYSTPPAHGGRIVETVLADPALRASWLAELATMRDRIDQMRNLLVAGLAERVGRDEFAFIAGQRGMFSYSGLSADQARQLRDEHAVYIVDSGRINVAGLNGQNLDQVAIAIAAVSLAKV
jgi:aspartate/tyrosine/aromatic aminotransferase